MWLKNATGGNCFPSTGAAKLHASHSTPPPGGAENRQCCPNCPGGAGDSDKLTVGEFVVAIGNPGGLELERSVTLGITAATDRSFDVYDWVFGLIQTDAAINPGNSGRAAGKLAR